MQLKEILVQKMHSMGEYGSQSSSIISLKTGIKDYTQIEFEKAIIDLFKEGIIIISNTMGFPSISLNAHKKNIIRCKYLN